MIDGAKIQLSSAERRLVMDPEWILTKNSIMGKVVELMAGLSPVVRRCWAAVVLPEGVVTPDPKISKGENYKGLPYVVLDYPRIFGREDVLAVRTMFWWGHAFSVTLHLKGRYKNLFLPVIRSHWEELASAGFHIGVSQDEWQHEHAPGNYAALTGTMLERVSEEGPFLKLSARCGLDRWEEAPEWMEEQFRVLVGVLGSGVA
jgi:hypothetical protein